MFLFMGLGKESGFELKDELSSLSPEFVDSIVGGFLDKLVNPTPEQDIEDIHRGEDYPGTHAIVDVIAGHIADRRYKPTDRQLIEYGARLAIQSINELAEEQALAARLSNMEA